MDDHEKKMVAMAEARKRGPRPGSTWRHYKGGLYIVLGNSIKESTQEHEVVYTSIEYPGWKHRPVEEWFGSVEWLGNRVPRYIEVPTQ